MTKKTRKLIMGILVATLALIFVVWVKVILLPMFASPLNGGPPPNSQFSTIFMVSIFVIGGAMYFLIPSKPEPTTAHGSAHFATRSELKTYGTLALNPRQERTTTSQALVNEEIPPSKMHLGIYQKRLIALDERMQESHVFLLAPTGVGKTSRVILPALLREYGSRSLFINDTKGELTSKALGHLSQYHRCWIFAPTDPRASHHYNPLSHVHNMDDAEALAHCLIDNTGKSQESFWESAPKLLVAATILHLRKAEPNAPFSRLIDILYGMKLQDIESMFRSSPSSIAQDVATAFFENLQKNDRLAGSIMVDISSRFFRFKNPSLREVTSSNDLDFTRLVDDPTAVFLSIPEGEAERLEPLSACFVMQMMNALVRRATYSPGGRLPRGFAFYLDEFCNAGKIPNFTKYISTVRSRGIAFIVAAQDFGQLRATYGEDGRNTILSNCRTHIVCPGCGLEETSYYSRKLGKTTVQTISNSERESSSMGAQATWTHGETQRDLMTSDEIRTMQDGTLLTLIGQWHPLLVENTAYYQDPELLARVRLPFTPPASRVTVTPVPSTPPPPRAGLPALKAPPKQQQAAPGTPPPPKTPPAQQQQTSSPKQDNTQFFSPE